MLIKNLKSLTTMCLLSTQLLTFSSAFAKGGSMDGGGGDFLVTGNGVVLADPYSTPDKVLKKSKLFFLSEELKQEIKLAIRLGQNMFKVSDVSLNSAIFNDEINYRFVESIPDNIICKERLKYGNLPDNGSIVQGACTVGDDTYIVGDLFRKMSIKDQAITIIHEGLRRLRIDEEVLVDITNGFNFLLTEYNLQSRGEFRELNTEEKDKIIKLGKALRRVEIIRVYERWDGRRTIYKLISKNSDWMNYTGSWKDPKDLTLLYEKVDYSFENDYHVTSYGGAIEEGANIQLSKNSKLGIGTLITKDDTKSHVVIGDNSVLFNSQIYCESDSNESCVIGDNALVINTKLPKNFTIGNNSKITDSLLLPDLKLIINNNVNISNSQIKNTGAFFIGDGTNIKNTIMNIGNLDNRKNDLKVEKANLTIENNANLMNVTLNQVDGFTDVKFKKSSEVKDYTCNVVGSYDIYFRTNLKIAKVSDLDMQCRNKESKK